VIRTNNNIAGKSILIQAWTIIKCGNNLYLPYTHWVYLNEIVNYYSKVCLLSIIKQVPESEIKSLRSINNFKSVEIVKLPYSVTYMGAIQNFFSYLKIYKNLTGFNVFYARYPIPFGWLAKVYHRDKTRIIHFVGDPIDATKNNPNLGKIKKFLMLAFFKPEHLMYLWACKNAHVYTNGFHIAEKLKMKGVNAEPLVSSTLIKSDYFLKKNKIIKPDSPKLVYVGYLRKAKGIETLIKSFQLVQNKFPNAIFSIIGTGEYQADLKALVIQLNLKNVDFLGHIEDRCMLNKILRAHDIFCFASLSEGSPRVVLEAMANGLAVVSTPVGSLPGTFTAKKDILFADFNNPNAFFQQIEQLINHPKLYSEITNNAYVKVQSFTIPSFLKKIFDEK
jgi:glycosyltransferase involved in cell wall biosynthesis